MGSVALRDVVELFVAALGLTVPLPEPLAPAVTVSQLALLVAVHVQPVPAVTFVLPVPPPAPTFADDDDSEYVHAVPACETENVSPAMVSVALRDVVELFAPALKLTVPLPEPLAPAVTVSQLALLVAVHAQP